MSVLSKIKGLFSFSRDRSIAEDGRATTIVDVDTLSHSSGNGRHLSPQDKISALKRLSVFVEKEKLPIVAVLCGSPLRAVADGEQFRGVTVRYVDKKDDIAGFMVTLLKEKRSRETCIVVTADRQTEQAVQAVGGSVMHPATFRKALDPVEVPRPRQQVSNAPVPKPVDENQRIVNELIDPL